MSNLALVFLLYLMPTLTLADRLLYVEKASEKEYQIKSIEFPSMKESIVFKNSTMPINYIASSDLKSFYFIEGKYLVGRANGSSKPFLKVKLPPRSRADQSQMWIDQKSKNIYLVYYVNLYAEEVKGESYIFENHKYAGSPSLNSGPMMAIAAILQNNSWKRLEAQPDHFERLKIYQEKQKSILNGHNTVLRGDCGLDESEILSTSTNAGGDVKKFCESSLANFKKATGSADTGFGFLKTKFNTVFVNTKRMGDSLHDMPPVVFYKNTATISEIKRLKETETFHQIQLVPSDSYLMVTYEYDTNAPLIYALDSAKLLVHLKSAISASWIETPAQSF